MLDNIVFFSEDVFIDSRDKAAMDALYNNDASKTILKFISDNGLEGIYEYIYKSSYARLTENTSPVIFECLKTSCEMFALDSIPEIYAEFSYENTASLGGMNKPFITLNTEYIRTVDKKTLLGIIASKTAEIKAGHAQVRFMMWVLEMVGQYIPALLSKILTAALDECEKNMVYTSDRAFYLATRNYGLTVQQMFGNKISKEMADRFCITDNKCGEYCFQYDDFFEYKNNHSELHMLQSILSSQPFIPVRIERLNAFIEEEAI